MARKTYTSTSVKTRWNRKHYDKIAALVPKGRKADIAAKAAEEGESVNSLVNRIVREALGIAPEEWRNSIPQDQKE